MPVHAERVQFDQYSGYLARPAGVAAGLPGVVVIQEIWGVDAHIEDLARRLAGAGYAALAPDLFAGRGERPEALAADRLAEVQAFANGMTGGSWTDPAVRAAALAGRPGADRIEASFGAMMGTLGRLDSFVPALRAAVRHLRAECPASRGQKVACVGFCMGGGLSALLACEEPELAGAAIFYGSAPPPGAGAADRLPGHRLLRRPGRPGQRRPAGLRRGPGRRGPAVPAPGLRGGGARLLQRHPAQLPPRGRPGRLCPAAGVPAPGHVMAQAAGFLVLAKPAGPRCNLRCDYCYYLAKDAQFADGGPRRMADDLLERHIRERLAAPGGPVVRFDWHGGEPTLLGLDYFQRIVALQQAHCPPGRTVANGLQTNGTLLDPAWARFLRAEGFSVGLSLDGPAAGHDGWRRHGDGRASHAEAVRGLRLLQRHGVPCDVTCVLHAGNTADPLETYAFFRDLGVASLQFLPLVAAGPATPGPEAVGRFLCRVFDQWIRHDLGRIVIQLFDEALRPALGLEHALCLFRETCGEVLVLEHDGGVYACDHFVDPAHRLGSLRDRPLAELAASPAQRAFGEAKRSTLPGACLACDVLAWCHGGCPKDRIVPDRRGQLQNALCPAYQRFFRHARPVLARLAAHWRAGRPLSAFGIRPPGRGGK